MGAAMAILRIQHEVQSFDRWKQVFDADPLDRKGSGVRRYAVHRSVGDPVRVMVDLEFDAVDKAEAMLVKLRRLWDGPGREVMQNPEGWIVETVEAKDL
jgi:hypothetical protein